MTAAPPGIIFSDVVIGYDREPVLRDVSGRFALGSVTAVIGPNGAGKSTLLKAVAGLLLPQAGKISFNGCAGCDVAYLPQRAEIDRDFPISALDLVLLGAWRHSGGLRAASRQSIAASRAALEKVGLSGQEESAIGSLSIGQFQRALFARLIVQDARIVLLDEPFAAIDAGTTAHMLGLITEWHEEGRTILAALHDLNQVRDHFPQALLLNRRVIAWGRSDEILAAAGHAHIHLEADCGGETARFGR